MQGLDLRRIAWRKDRRTPPLQRTPEAVQTLAACECWRLRGSLVSLLPAHAERPQRWPPLDSMHLMRDLSVRIAAPDEFECVRTTYAAWGYGGGANSADTIFVAEGAGELLGLV